MARILLIDDDSLMVRMYQKKLLNDGYVVETASDGVEGLEKVVSFNPDLILLDVMMPKLNGIQVLEKLQDRPEYKDIPVILLTNVSSNDETAEKGLELGAVAYITKAGNRPDVVVEKVKEILSGYTKDEIPKVKSTIIQD